MIFLEDHARLLLVAHTVLAAALVASSTHLVVWLRRFPRGEFTRIAAARRFATISATLFVITFVFGNLIYPTYKVRVRADFFEHGSAIAREADAQADSRAEMRNRYEHGKALRERRESPPEIEPEVADTTGAVKYAAQIARWFDVKEHWIALGMMFSLLCAVILRAWNPKRDGPQLAWSVFGFAVAACLSVWFAAIVGVVVTSVRAVGQLG